MSQTGPGVVGLPLFADPAPAPVQSVHDRGEEKHREFLDRVRRLLGGIYTGCEITTDEAWLTMERYGIRLPDGASPNLLGSLFSRWSRARSTGRVVRSKRSGANGNLLTVWAIE